MKRLDWLWRRKQLEAEIAGEVANHLAERAEELERRGLPAQEARRRARLEFGSPEKYTEQAREAAGTHALATLAQDARYAARLLRRSPGFTLTAVLLLALGIGANAAIYSMVDWLLLRPLSVAQPGQLSYLVADTASGGHSNGLSYPNFRDIRAQTGAVFSGMAGVEPFQLDGITSGGATSTLWTGYVAGDLFGLLGIHPALGRFFRPPGGDDARTPAELVLSYAYWASHFGERRDVVGATVKVNGRPFTIVGVTPRRFHGVLPVLNTDAYVPIRFVAGEMGGSTDPLHDRAGGAGLIVVGRRRPGVPLALAQPALAVVGRRLAAAYPKQDPWRALRALPLTSEPPGAAAAGASDPLHLVAGLFLALAAMVLLLACVNIANLLLARSAVRAREMAVRAALGAGRWRLLRQMLTESLLLALLGGTAGLLVAALACHALDALPLGAGVPITLSFALNGRVFLYALGIALLTGLATGIVPAWQAARLAPDAVLRAGGRGLTGARTRLRSTLVTLEIAGSLALLIVAGLFTRSLTMAQHAHLGFDPNPVVNLSFDPHTAGYGEARGAAFADALLRHMRAVPGVASASVAAAIPTGLVSYGGRITVPGHPTAPGHSPAVDYNAVTPGYFATLGIPRLRGRGFLPGDDAAAPRVAVINQAMAERFWPGQNPIGRQFYRSRDRRRRPIQVVGIVGNSVTGSLGETPGAYYYVPFAQHYLAPATLQIKLAGADAATVLGEARAAARRLQPALAVYDGQTMTAAMHGLNGLLMYQLGAGLAAAMGLLGLAMAVIGVYGVIAYAASQRTQEIGVRLALGASRASILRMVLRQGLRITAAGLGLGLALAALLAGALGSLLMGVRPHDPLTYAAATLLLAAVALLAGLAPARRAMRQDPVAALRCE